MTKASQQKDSWDRAAEQAKKEGVSSFGYFRNQQVKTIKEYEAAAKARGVRFAIDQGGYAYFEDIYG